MNATCENKSAREVLTLHDVIPAILQGKDDSARIPIPHSCPLPDLWKIDAGSKVGRERPCVWDFAHSSAVSRVLGGTLSLDFHTGEGSRYFTHTAHGPRPLSKQLKNWLEIYCVDSRSASSFLVAAPEKLSKEAPVSVLSLIPALAQAIHQETLYGILLLLLYLQVPCPVPLSRTLDHVCLLVSCSLQGCVLQRGGS